MQEISIWSGYTLKTHDLMLKVLRLQIKDEDHPGPLSPYTSLQGN